MFYVRLKLTLNPNWTFIFFSLLFICSHNRELSCF